MVLTMTMANKAPAKPTNIVTFVSMASFTKDGLPSDLVKIEQRTLRINHNSKIVLLKYKESMF